MEKNITGKKFRGYYILSVVVTLALSFYPLYMGVKVIEDMITKGTVMKDDFPKYIIPYTPISLAIIIGVVLMPIIIKCAKRFSLLAVSVISTAAFFISEILLESQVIVTATQKTTLESWQMFMCYMPPEQYETRTWTAIDVLIGDYSPLFKLHFYVIAIVIILAFLNCFYGFAHIIMTGDKTRLKALIMQSVSTVLFLGLCIFACFTAFYRTGEITVSSLSATLMAVFFIVFGMTMGIYAGSFLLNKKNSIAIGISAAVAIAVTVIMYIGELILLSGHLYRFGTGFLFDGLGALVLAPVDLIIICLSGGITAFIIKIIKNK